MILLISLLLTLLPLLGVVGIAVYGTITTVDGLFTSLILLAISGTFAINVLLELRKPRGGAAKTQSGQLKPGFATGAGETIRQGRVEKVEFYEANVGQPNKSIVTLSTTSAPNQML